MGIPLIGSSSSNTKGSGIGLITNADRDLRMSPAERELAAIDDTNDQRFQQAEIEAQGRRNRGEHKIQLLLGDDRDVYMPIKDEEGNVTGRAPIVSMRHDLEETDWRNKRVPMDYRPGASVPGWPLKMFPIVTNEDALQSIINAYHCIRCGHYRELGPEQDACDACLLPLAIHRQCLGVLDELGETGWEPDHNMFGGGSGGAASGLVLPPAVHI